MGRAGRHKQAKGQSAAARPGGWLPRHRQAVFISLVVAAVVGTLAGVGYLARLDERRQASASVVVPRPVPMPAAKAQKFHTLDELLRFPADRLEEVDIAEMNLLCAAGLPGAERLDVGHALATLNQWAARVKSETDRHLYRVTHPRWADQYRHSEAYLRAYMLCQVLQQDLGVKYDMAAKDNFSFKDSRVAFIHGMIPAPGQTTADTPGGTCASMPVMYVAVGRRLGYPVFLVATKGHLFARWDGQGHSIPAWRERFNMESTGNGFASYEDDYYKNWPFKISDGEAKANGWLASLSGAECLAEFLTARGHCHLDNGRAVNAARCYENACGYDPTRPSYPHWFMEAAAQCNYRPVIPALARMLARRRGPADPRHAAVNLDLPRPSEMAAAAARSEQFFAPAPRVGQWQSLQPVTGGHQQYAPQMQPAPPQPPSPYGAQAPQPRMPNRYQNQPYQPPVLGQPNR